MTRKDSRDKKPRKNPGFGIDGHQETGSGQALGLAIGKRLRSYYDNIVAQPVPDRFVELLKKLEDSESGKKPR